MEPPRLDESSKAVKLLRRMMENGDITVDDEPKIIQASDPVFQDNKPETFRTRFNRLKKEYFSSYDLDDDVEEPSLKRKCTASTSKNKEDSKPFQVLSDIEGDDTAKRLFSHPTSIFSLLSMHSVWVEPGSTTKMVTMAIVLPSGVGPGQFSVRVVEGGRELELIIQWPRPLFDLELLHKKWIKSPSLDRMEVYYPKFLGFEAALKRCRDRATDIVESNAKFQIPFAVQSHKVRLHSLGWVDSDCRMVYVDLKALENEYAIARDDNSFEIC